MSTPFYARPTRWLPGSHDSALFLKGFETPAQVEVRHKKDVEVFTRKFPGCPVSAMAQCQPEALCNSGACPICMRLFRRWYISAALKMFAESSEPLVALSLIHPNWQRGPGELGGLDPELAKRQLAKCIVRAGLGRLVIVGGLDFSFNIHAGNRWEPHWQPHFYLICQGASRMAIKEALSGNGRSFKASLSIPRPVMATDVKNRMRAISYSMKSMFFRRSTYLGNDGAWNSRSLSLKPDQQAELTAFLDQHKPTDRMFLRNVRHHGLKLVKTGKALNSGD